MWEQFASKLSVSRKGKMWISSIIYSRVNFVKKLLRSLYHYFNNFESLLFQAMAYMYFVQILCNFKTSFVLAIHSETLKKYNFNMSANGKVISD